MNPDHKVEIIAEIAQGNEGDPKLTELLTTGAIASSADAIKYQLVYANELATPDYEYYELFQSLEMKKDIWMEISDRIHENEQKLYFDVFGVDSLYIAQEVGADGVKLSTTEFYNKALIERALKLFDNVFISIGGIPVNDIDLLVDEVLKDYYQKICLMYGFQSEPTPLDQNNLLKFNSFRARYPDYKLGFMDHSYGGSEEAYHLSLLAMGMGIEVIEKHLTLDRSLEIEDYVSGLSPANFKKFVELVRKYEPALGTASLDLSELENEYRNKATKSVVALKDLNKGHIIQSNDIALKRSGANGNGEPIRRLEDALNKKLKTDIKVNSPILKEQV